MKKNLSVIGSVALMAGFGYGAWMYYKKKNPECAHDMKDMIEAISKDVEKEVNERV